MKILDLFSNVCCTFSLHSFTAYFKHVWMLVLLHVLKRWRWFFHWSAKKLKELIFLEILINERLTVFEEWFVVNYTNVNEVAFPHKCAVKYSTWKPAKSIWLFLFSNKNEIALNFMNDGRHCSKKRRQNFLISISWINGLSSLAHNQKVLSYFIELGEFVINCDIAL